MKLTMSDTWDQQGDLVEGLSLYLEWLFKIYQSILGFIFALCQAPSMVKNIVFIGSMFFVIDFAHLSSTGTWLHNNLEKMPVYGPPKKLLNQSQSHISFEKVGKSFNTRFPLWRLGELEEEKLFSLIRKQTPRLLRPGLDKYIKKAFYYSQYYQLDPFWVLSIIWVESHFNPKVKSRVMASGLMQIMPKTSTWLNLLMNRSLYPELAYELTEDPDHNIQLGSFYLKRLLSKFKGNYVHATVAYNMGPGYTKRRLRYGKSVGKKNIYLNKVKRAYRRITRGVSLYMRHNVPAYYNTYIVKSKKASKHKGPHSIKWWEHDLLSKDFPNNTSLKRTSSSYKKLRNLHKFF